MACYETDARILLVGRTGNGKSSTGNTLIGQSPRSVIDFSGYVGVGESSMRRVLNEDQIPEETTCIETDKSSIVRKRLIEWENVPINIAVTGKSGTGKSGLINVLLDIFSARADTSSMIRDDTFCKTVLNRSLQKLSHVLDPYSLYDWCKIKGYLTYQQMRDFKEQILYSNKTRKPLQAVSSRGASGYKEMKRWLSTYHAYLFQYLGEQEAELVKIVMAVKEQEERNRQARAQRPVTHLHTGTFLQGLDSQSIDRCFKAISMRLEDEYSVIKKFHKQTLKARGQLIDFNSPCHEILEMVLYNTKMTVIESRTISTGWKDPYRDLYRTSAYLLILFGSTAFDEKQEFVQDIESIWKHIFWNKSLNTYSLSVLQKDKYEKETKDAEESITASRKEFLKFKYEAPVEVSVHIDHVSMEEQPTAGSYDKQAAEEFRALEQMLMCKVCLDADLCIVFFPCSHMATCESCASVMQNCPVCRSEIKESVKLNYE